MKVWPPVRFQTADLAVEHGTLHPHRVRDFLCELLPGLKPMAVAGDQLASMAGHIRERPEAVQLWLVDKLRVIERLRYPQQPHGGLDSHKGIPQLTGTRARRESPAQRTKKTHRPLVPSSQVFREFRAEKGPGATPPRLRLRPCQGRRSVRTGDLRRDRH